MILFNQNKKNIRRLFKIRSGLGMSQREMAEELGVVHGALAQWESGKAKIPGPVLKLLSLYEIELGLTSQPQAEEISTTRLSRSLKLAKAGVDVATTTFIGALKKIFFPESKKSNLIQVKTRERIAFQIIDVLGKLKGLPQKMGQLYSYLYFSLNPEIKQEYSRLQNKAPAISTSQIVDVIVEEFGKTPNQLFKEWDKKPLASASIGQVHKAWLKDGTPVAMKVQYPGIVKALESDLSNASVIEFLVTKVIQAQKPYLIEEIKKHFLEECDYLKEAETQENFRKRFAANKKILIPKVYSEYTGKKVLTTDCIEGDNLDEFINKSTPEKKQEAACVIIDFYMKSLFEYHEFHTDPHPGNFLFLKDKVAFFDFGSVKKMEEKDFKEWKTLVGSLLMEDKKSFKKILIDLGAISTDGPIDYDYFYDLLREVTEPFWHNGLYEFRREKLAQIWNKFLYNNPNYQQTNQPREHFFLNKMLWGVYGLLCDLQAKVNWHQRIKKYFSISH